MDILELIIQALRKAADELERDRESGTVNFATLSATDTALQHSLTLLRQVGDSIESLCTYVGHKSSVVPRVLTPHTRKESHANTG